MGAFITQTSTSAAARPRLRGGRQEFINEAARDAPNGVADRPKGTTCST